MAKNLSECRTRGLAGTIIHVARPARSGERHNICAVAAELLPVSTKHAHTQNKMTCACIHKQA